jgi:rare lipoprotein A
MARPSGRLHELALSEKGLVAELKKERTAPALYALAQNRYEQALQKRKVRSMPEAEMRRYLISKALPLLKLNLGRRGKTAVAKGGASYAFMSIVLINKIMVSIKAAVKNLPAARSKRDGHGHPSFYGGEEIYKSGFGPEFHSRHTRSGDRFCMFGQTAAFMRAPLGSWVRVRNDRTGRWIDVRVNDTGAFEEKGFIIDLSRGAYHALGIRDRDRVSIRRIKSSEAIPEPLLCSGRGEFHPDHHLRAEHAVLPTRFRAR